MALKDPHHSPKFSRSALIGITLILLLPVEIFINTRLPSNGPLWLQGGMFVLTMSTPFLAIFFGILGRREDRLSGYTGGGTGTATTAIVLGILVLSIASWTAIQTLRADCRVPQTRAAYDTMRYGVALYQFRRLHPEEGYPGSLEELRRDPAATTYPRSIEGETWPVNLDAEKGYAFTYLASRSQVGGPNDGFQLSVDPVSEFWTPRHYFLDQTGKLTFSENHPANPQSPLWEDIPTFY
jgi:hypothetical protein